MKKVLEEKQEGIAPGTLLGTTHTYVIYFLGIFFISVPLCNFFL